MEASIVELRYKTKDILSALERNEEVKIFYHGKEKGVILPAHRPTVQKVEETAFFGMSKHQKIPVNRLMEKLRGGRYSDI